MASPSHRPTWYFVGIGPQKFSGAFKDQAVKSRAQDLQHLYKDKYMIFGVDRLDYTKSLPEKFNGFQAFLDEHPEWAENVVHIQIAIPGREKVEVYRFADWPGRPYDWDESI
ncbi:unnamed protein product [Penicillium pancosmium]